MEKNKNYLGTADKVVIALGFAFFLTASGLIMNEYNKLNKRNNVFTWKLRKELVEALMEKYDLSPKNNTIEERINEQRGLLYLYSPCLIALLVFLR